MPATRTRISTATTACCHVIVVFALESVPVSDQLIAMSGTGLDCELDALLGHTPSTTTKRGPVNCWVAGA